MNETQKEGQRAEDGRQISLQPSGLSPQRLQVNHLDTALNHLSVVQQARSLMAAGIPVSRIHIGSYNWQKIRRLLKQVENTPNPTAADLMPKPKTGRKPKHGATVKDIEVIKKTYLVTNRNSTAGSANMAARLAFVDNQLSPGLAATIAGRIQRGRQHLLPDSLRRQVIVPEVLVKQFRSPTDADLDYFCAPGTMMWVKDPAAPGGERFIRSGDVIEMDDATINFCCCVPWEVGGCPCSDKYGVKVGRFQWLVAIDAASRYVPGYSYTARSKSSYRSEDILALMHRLFQSHGIWNWARLEQGVFASNKVTGALRMLGIQHWPVHSPHNKPFIEGLFNYMWTILAGMPGQVGRFQGEEEEIQSTLRSCQGGSKDPRKYFPMLADVCVAFDKAIRVRHTAAVHSPEYGTWVPAERWQQQLARHPMRKMDTASAWMLSPEVRKWQVKGTVVGGSVNIMPGFSIHFDFSASWLVDFHGAKVRVYFDPAGEPVATIVLDKDVRNVKAGTVLGKAVQVNKVTRYGRNAIWSLYDADEGLAARKAAAAHVRREIRTIVPEGKPAIQVSQVISGGNSATIVRGIESDPSSVLGPRSSDLGSKTAAPRPRIADLRPRISRSQDVILDALSNAAD